MSATTYGDISQRTAVYAAKTMLEHVVYNSIFGLFGQTLPMPKNTANAVKFRRAVPYAVSTAPLVEGVTPSSKKITFEDVTATLQQYGDVAELTDVVADLAEDPVLMKMSELAGEQAAETIERVCYGVVKAGTNVFYDTTAHTTRATVDSKITRNRVRAVVRSLKANLAKTIKSVQNSTVQYGTRSIEASFIAMCHSDLDADIRDMSGFISVADYGSREPICAEELGTVENVRFITNPLLTPYQAAGAAVGSTGMIADDATNIDVYPVLFFGKDAYGHIPLKGANAITPSVLNPATPSKSDPLGQRGTVGWKTYYTAAILNQTWMARLEVGASNV